MESREKEEKSSRGRSIGKVIFWLIGFLAFIIIGLLILNALTGIIDELRKQTDIIVKQTNIWQSIERQIQELLKQIRQFMS